MSPLRIWWEGVVYRCTEITVLPPTRLSVVGAAMFATAFAMMIGMAAGRGAYIRSYVQRGLPVEWRCQTALNNFVCLRWAGHDPLLPNGQALRPMD